MTKFDSVTSDPYTPAWVTSDTCVGVATNINDTIPAAIHADYLTIPRGSALTKSASASFVDVGSGDYLPLARLDSGIVATRRRSADGTIQRT